MKDVLAPWRIVSHLSRLDLLPHDPLAFDPFADPESAALIRRRSRPVTRTGSLLPEDLLRLMSAAAVWVLDYARHVIDAWEATLDLANRDVRDPSERDTVAASVLAHAPPSFPPLRLVVRRADHARNEGRMTAAEAVKHLLTACGILVGGFGARRVGEITSLRTGCLVEDERGILGLTIYIEKSLRDLDTIPVPAMMRNVVSTLERLTAPTRSVTGREWLFEVGASETCTSFVSFDLSRTMNDFAEANGLPPPSGQARWDLKAHQLRRGFAIAYYHGFRASSFDALSRFLRHLDPEMTRVYVNQVTSGAMGRLREAIDARTKTALSAISEDDRAWMADAKRLLQDVSDRGDAFEEVRCESLVHRMLGLWDDTERPIGLGVRSLRDDLDAMVRDVTASVRLGSRSNDPNAARVPLVGRLREYARTHRLEPVPGGPAHCTARPGHDEDLSLAECVKVKARSPGAVSTPTDGTAPDFAFASAYVCLGCPLCVVFEDGQTMIGEVQARLSLASRRAATPSAAGSASRRLFAFKAAISAARDASGKAA